MPRPKWIKSHNLDRKDILAYQNQLNLSSLSLDYALIEFRKKYLIQLRNKITEIANTKKSTIYVTKCMRKYFISLGYAVFEEVKTDVPIIDIKEKYGEINSLTMRKKNKLPLQYNLFKTEINADIYGFIDLRIVSKKEVLDIEIDSKNSKHSLSKLMYSKNDLGYKVLWIRHQNAMSLKIDKLAKKSNINVLKLYEDCQ